MTIDGPRLLLVTKAQLDEGYLEFDVLSIDSVRRRPYEVWQVLGNKRYLVLAPEVGR